MTTKPKANTKKKVEKPVATKTTTKAKSAKANAKQAPAEKLSQMAAAERVLAEAGEPMNCKAMVEAMGAKGYWTSPGGATPAATLYASLLRHIRQHGKQAKFTKIDRGQFALAGKR